MQPTAKVIAYTHFTQVPDELMPLNELGRPDGLLVAEKNQDQGSDGARLLECAGRTCYDSYGKGRPSADYHANILKVQHGSVLEHASISFFLTMSRGCSHEWVRHRVGVAISQRSTRYVDESDSVWNLHPLLVQLMDDPKKHGVREDIVYDIQSYISKGKGLYKEIVHAIEIMLVNRQITLDGGSLDISVDKLAARKQARGAGRGLLGNALSTEMVWTANIRALRHVIEMRATEFAEAEVRLLANAVYEAARPFCPEYLGDYEEYPSPDGIGYCLRTQHRKV
jgi:thymidylate synthase (FAD)